MAMVGGKQPRDGLVAKVTTQGKLAHRAVCHPDRQNEASQEGGRALARRIPRPDVTLGEDSA
jgi:hypothetical protein